MRAVAAYIADLGDGIGVQLLLHTEIPELDICRILTPRSPRIVVWKVACRNRGGDVRRIRASDRAQISPVRASIKLSVRQQVRPGFAVTRAAVSNSSRMHDAIASADNESSARIPCKPNPRLKLLFRWVKGGFRGVYAELLPVRDARTVGEENGAGFVECITMVNLAK